LWLQQTQAILEKSRDERNNSQLLYTEVSRAMLAAADHSFSVWYETNSAFTTRIAEICHAKKELERHLSKLYADIDTIKRHIAEVQKALDEKKPLLLVRAPFSFDNFNILRRKSEP
jgi:septal ring factor EnvC (AmiA/AmiB activator)